MLARAPSLFLSSVDARAFIVITPSSLSVRDDPIAPGIPSKAERCSTGSPLSRQMSCGESEPPTNVTYVTYQLVTFGSVAAHRRAMPLVIQQCWFTQLAGQAGKPYVFEFKNVGMLQHRIFPYTVMTSGLC